MSRMTAIINQSSNWVACLLVLWLVPLSTSASIIEVREGDRIQDAVNAAQPGDCLLYTSPSPRDGLLSRMPSSA